MENKEIESKLKEILKKHVDEPELINDLQCEESLESVGLNSIIFVKLVIDIETEFDIEFLDEDMSYKKFVDLNSLASYVKTRMEAEE